MIRKAFILLTLVVTTLFAGCEKYDHAIADLQDRLNALEGAKIPSIEQQIANINVSIEDLKAVDVQLQQLIDDLDDKAKDLQTQLDANAAADAATKKALENEIANIKTLIAALQAKDTELDQKIADLKTYVDGEITATEDWANATFATLTQYAAMEQEIADIKALIERYKSEITAAYTKAISDAITASETSMKAWVNETLANGYYDIAAIDAKLAALETELTDADKELAKQIEDQQAALEQAKKDLTAAYEKAIADAIEANNGVINAAIAKAVEDALDKVDTKLAVIDNAIAAIQKDIDAIKNNIATIEEQIKGINASIKDLQDVDTALQTLINNLEAETANLQKQLDENAAADAATKKALEDEIANIKTLITALQAKDAELDQKIADLQTYVDGEIKNTEDWANATFATLTQFETMSQTISNLETLIEKYNTDITAAYTKAISDAITASETSMKAWVNEELQKVYNEIADLQTQLTDLAANGATDQELADAVAAQQTALEQAKSDLTAAYQQAIAEAITTNNGVIDGKIADAVSAAQNALQSQINQINTAIDAINDRLKALEDNFANRIQSLKYVPQYTDGKIAINYAESRAATVYFRVSPAAVAKLVKLENVTAYARETDDPSTRALNPELSMQVTAVDGDDTGIIEVKLQESAAAPFSEKFWKGETEAVVYIRIADANGNDVVSDMVPVVAKGFSVTALATPANPKDETAYGTYKVSWNAVTYADFYYVCWNEADKNEPFTNTSAWTKVETTSAEKSYDTESVAAGTVQQVYVVAGTNSTLYTPSTMLSFEVKAAAAPAPATGKVIEYTADSQITFATETPFGAVAYTHTFADGKGTITIDSSVEKFVIAANAFRETAITSIILPEGVATLGSYSFAKCVSLTSVVIPASVTAIGNSAFYQCSSLSTVKYYGTSQPAPVSSSVFLGTSVKYIQVPVGYEEEVFAGKAVKKVL